MNRRRKPYVEISLRPYNGRLFVARTKRDYEKAHEILFKEPDILTCAQGGRFSGGCGKDDMWTYLIWAAAPHTLAHEASHVVLHVFQRCGIDPVASGGEPFCYLLSQILLDIKVLLK